MSPDSRLQVQFETIEQQQHAVRLGVWLLLASEVLLFAGLFALYAAYRLRFGADFVEGVRHTTHWAGLAMTLLLVTSSFVVALAVGAARDGDRGRRLMARLAVAIAIGSAFLMLKGIEYGLHASEGILPGLAYDYDRLPTAAGNAFFNLYYATTGLHALHVVAGLVALGVVFVAAWRGRLGDDLPVEMVALYWHLVDVFWLFLWPMFYLMG